MFEDHTQQITELAQSLMQTDKVCLLLHGKPHTAALQLIDNLAQQQKLQHLYVSEACPVASVSTQTLNELGSNGIAATLISDTASAHLYQHARIDWLLLGAQRIARNGDVIAQIGSYQHALLAQKHDIKTLVLAEHHCIEPELTQGSYAQLQQGQAHMLLGNKPSLNRHAQLSVAVPLQDITPAHLITAIVTEKGLILSPDAAALSVQLG